MDSNFTTRGNEPLEARIVAWVLGEASAFEIDELERLCREQPELAVFKRRIEAVHGLALQAHCHQDDGQWKLPLKKRAAIEELIGAQETIAEDMARDHRVGRSGRRALLAIAACLVLTLVVASVMSPVLLSQKKSASNSYERSAYYRFAQETAAVDEMSELNEDFARKGKAKMAPPASSMTSVITSSGDHRATIPVPKAQTAAPSLEFSDGDHFSRGWGEAGGSAGGGAVNEKLASRRSGGQPELLYRGDVIVEDNLESLGGKFAARPVPGAQAAPAAQPGPLEGEGEGANSIQHGVSVDAEVDAFAPADPSSAGGQVKPAEEVAADDKGGYAYKFRSEGKDEASEPGLRAYGAASEATFYSLNAETTNQWNAPTLGDLPAVGGLKRDLSELKKSELQGEFKGDKGLETYANGRVQLLEKRLVEASELDAEAPPQARVEGEKKSLLAEREMLRRENTAVEADDRARNGLVDKDLTVDEVRFYAEKLDDMSEVAQLRDKLVDAKADPAVINELNERLTMKSEAKVFTTEEADKKKNEKVIKERPIVTDDEIVAAEEPYSTFSLNINDASFRMAQAALAKGEMPDPSGIKVEQFYNAVDYGDPSPAAGQPVACNIEQTAHPVIPGRNLVRVALKTAAEGRNQGQPLRLTLLIDQSGSMAREDRRQAMVEALEGLRGLLGENDQVNVIGFARTPRLLAEAVKGNEGQLANLVNIEANEGGTNLEEAIKLGQQLAERHQLEGAQNRMVLFTDGAANLGDADPDSLANKIKELRQKDIAFDIAGIVADGLNDELLGEMARHGNGRYYVVGKGSKAKFAEQLAGAFRPAAENVKVQVHFNPERVGRYKLIGFEKDRLNKEDFRNDAVDAAEMAAEEAGVAIYQVETLPEGNGEIGEVSVRFRDMASGEMVERGWTISHEASTPALDQARPSMQLATLAMMAGEKLKGGPLADAVDFNQMGEVIAKVNQHFKGDPKAAEMLHMIDQLK